MGWPPGLVQNERVAPRLKILIWHGYLLGGTGSNVYTRALARVWSAQGHEVVVFCQEPRPELFDLGGARVVRPDLGGGPLPVFVLDRYEDLEARYLQDLAPEEREKFVHANAAAVRDHLPTDFLLVNHVLLGAPVGAAVGVPFTVKAHGSELEFSMRGNQELAAWACETLEPASEILAGSEHIRGVLEEVLGAGDHLERVRVVPPGVDVEAFRPAARDEALAALLEEARRDPPNPDRASERLPDPGNAERLGSFLAAGGAPVVYIGKLSAEKGPHLLLESLSQVDGRAVFVGFGLARDELEERAARELPGRVLFTGPLEHRHLVHLLPLARVAVTPSVFPEAFGMVAAEAASCGAPPLVARHSGLAEIAEGIEAEYPREYRALASFEPGSSADLARKLGEILELEDGEWRRLSEAARRVVVHRWSWDRVGEMILAGADAGARART